MVAIILDEPTLVVRHHHSSAVAGGGRGVTAATTTVTNLSSSSSSSLTPSTADAVVVVSSSPSSKDIGEFDCHHNHHQKPIQQQSTKHKQQQHYRRRKTVSFAPSSTRNQIYEIPSCHEMTKEEKLHVYYTKQEYQHIQANILLNIRKHRNMKPTPAILAAAASTKKPSFTSSTSDHFDDYEGIFDFGISYLFDFLSLTPVADDSDNDVVEDTYNTVNENDSDSSSDTDDSENDDESTASIRGLENFVTDLQSNKRRNRINLAINTILKRQCQIGSKNFMNNNKDNEQWLNTVYRPLSIAAATNARHYGILDEQNVPLMYPRNQVMRR